MAASDNGAGGASGTHDCHADCVPTFGSNINPPQTDGNRAAMLAQLQRGGGANDGAAMSGGLALPEAR